MNLEGAKADTDGVYGIRSLEDVCVLLLESDSTCRKIISRMLIKTGYKVVTARRARDAFRIIRERENEVHLLLAESHLPDMDKYELLERMKEMSRIPVVIMCAGADENSILGCLFKGAVLHIIKPITMSDVKFLWQFVIISRRDASIAPNHLGSMQGKPNGKGCNDEVQSRLVPIENRKRREPEEVNRIVQEQKEEVADSEVIKRQKLIGTGDMHGRVLHAVSALGIDVADPDAILKHMNVPELGGDFMRSPLQNHCSPPNQVHDGMALSWRGHGPVAPLGFHGNQPQFPDLHHPTEPFPLQITDHYRQNASSFAAVNFQNIMDLTSFNPLFSDFPQVTLPPQVMPGNNQFGPANPEFSPAAMMVPNATNPTYFLENVDPNPQPVPELPLYITDFKFEDWPALLDDPLLEQDLNLDLEGLDLEQFPLPEWHPVAPPEQDRPDMFGAGNGEAAGPSQATDGPEEPQPFCIADFFNNDLW